MTKLKMAFKLLQKLIVTTVVLAMLISPVGALAEEVDVVITPEDQSSGTGEYTVEITTDPEPAEIVESATEPGEFSGDEIDVTVELEVADIAPNENAQPNHEMSAAKITAPDGWEINYGDFDPQSDIIINAGTPSESYGVANNATSGWTGKAYEGHITLWALNADSYLGVGESLTVNFGATPKEIVSGSPIPTQEFNAEAWRSPGNNKPIDRIDTETGETTFPQGHELVGMTVGSGGTLTVVSDPDDESDPEEEEPEEEEPLTETEEPESEPLSDPVDLEFTPVALLTLPEEEETIAALLPLIAAVDVVQLPEVVQVQPEIPEVVPEVAVSAVRVFSWWPLLLLLIPAIIWFMLARLVLVRIPGKDEEYKTVARKLARRSNKRWFVEIEKELGKYLAKHGEVMVDFRGGLIKEANKAVYSGDNLLSAGETRYAIINKQRFTSWVDELKEQVSQIA
jgi:hypothetical protein